MALYVRGWRAREPVDHRTDLRGSDWSCEPMPDYGEPEPPKLILLGCKPNLRPGPPPEPSRVPARWPHPDTIPKPRPRPDPLIGPLPREAYECEVCGRLPGEHVGEGAYCAQCDDVARPVQEWIDWARPLGLADVAERQVVEDCLAGAAEARSVAEAGREELLRRSKGVLSERVRRRLFHGHKALLEGTRGGELCDDPRAGAASIKLAGLILLAELDQWPDPARPLDGPAPIGGVA